MSARATFLGMFCSLVMSPRALLELIVAIYKNY